MSRPAPLLVVTPLLGLVLVLSGCSAAEEAEVAAPAENVVQAGAPGESSVAVDPTAVPSVGELAHTGADVEFATGMIAHHAQAIVMTAMVEDRSDDPELEQFVERMDVSQVAEIEQMQGWLEERGEEVPAWDPVFGEQGGHPGGMDGMHADGSGTDGHGPMPGMATPERLDALEAASGEDFDRLFLQTMTEHHQGALQMVDTLFAEGGGGETEVFTIASHVISDQGIEIDRMAGMLAELDA